MARPPLRDASFPYQFRGKRAASAAKRDPEPLSDGCTEIREGRPRAKIHGSHAWTSDEYWNALARVIRGWRCGIVAVVCRDEEQVVLAQGRDHGRQSPVELAQRSIEPRSVVSVPKKLVEIY